MFYEARECRGCGEAYVALRPNQARCKPGCGWERTSSTNAARATMRALPIEFIGIDGEGVTDPETGEHRYVLLSCGDKHLSNDGAHLDILEILPFLWSCFEENPRAAYVGFYLGYDFTQWIRTLPEDRARLLLTPEGMAKRRRPAGYQERLGPYPVWYRGWDIDCLYGRRFKFRPGGKPRVKGPWMWICDSGPFFQCSFLKAIDPAKSNDPVVSREEYELIGRGKERRSSAEFDPRMVEYNQLECDVLARLMRQHDEGIRSIELKLHRQQWFGPGQVAEKWMAKIGAPRGARVREVVPEGARDAARASYFGGWAETFWHGPVKGESWSYDINSAYPDIMSRLPCPICEGCWQHEILRGGKGSDLRRFGLSAIGELGVAFVRARVEGKHTVVGSMLHRLPNRRILRPSITEGWYVAAELAAAIDAYWVDKVRLYEVWRYEPCSCPPPLRELRVLYEDRLAVGKDTIPGKARKLVYNSVAGKCQQSVGMPNWGNPVYATLITAGTRTQITRAIASHPKGAFASLMVATDSVFFDSPHSGLDEDEQRLGAWSKHCHHNLSIFRPGIYWDDASRERIASGLPAIFKSRGIPAKAFSRQITRIDRLWEQFKKHGWPTIATPIDFQLISAKQAIARNDWALCGTVITDKAKNQTANPVDKRHAFGPGRSRPHKGGVGFPSSMPYEGAFGDELRSAWGEDFGDHPDGEITRLAWEALHDK